MNKTFRNIFICTVLITQLCALSLIPAVSAQSTDATEITDSVSDNSKTVDRNDTFAPWKILKFSMSIGTKKIIDAPFINQRVKFPNGCESVSAVMALQYFGIDITPELFISKYLDMGRAPYIRGGRWYGCDPRKQFPGDPRNSTGWGCYPEVIKKAIDNLNPQGFQAHVLKDVSLSTLCSEYIDNGIPVVFWGTIDMRAPFTHVTWTIEGTDSSHTWISPFHCLLLVGYDSYNYYFNDPWQGKNIPYPRDKVELAYSGIGREALVIIKI